MGDTRANLSVADIEAYLKANPDLFLQHPHLLDVIELNQSPTGTISLAQRQYQRSREKNKQINEQLHALIDTAHSNAALEQRVHELCLRLLDASDLAALIDVVVKELKHEFSADDVAIRLFGHDKPLMLPETTLNVRQLHSDDNELKNFDNILGKQQPVCGRLTNAQKSFLFTDSAEAIQSVVCLPLGHEPCAGLLAIGSNDANRFHADMGTDYLRFLGEIFMRGLRQHSYSHHE